MHNYGRQVYKNMYSLSSTGVCCLRLMPKTGEVLQGGIYSGTCEQCGNVVKFWSVPNPVASITFTVNGSEYNIIDPDPMVSLNEWIRSQNVKLKGNHKLCLR